MHRSFISLIALAACAEARGGVVDPVVTAATPPAPVQQAPEAAPALGDATSTARITRAYIVSRVGNADVADDLPKRARRDDGVTLYLALETDDGAWFSDAGAIRIAKSKHAARPIAEAPAFEVAWRKLEPTATDLSNNRGEFAYERIPYELTALADGVTRVAADVHPTLTPDHGDGVGTMRYQVEVTQGDTTITTPGAETRRKRGSGGLTDAVHRVSLRGDDSYLGYLDELFGQPYIWASAGGTDATHQSERLEGSDCADFIVYGWRRLGHDVAYTWTGGLPEVTRLLSEGAVGDDGVYRDAHGEPLAFPRVGDLILFPRHVGALVEDRGTPGVLDTDDVIAHALFDSPKRVPIASSGYADRPVELRRWK